MKSYIIYLILYIVRVDSMPIFAGHFFHCNIKCQQEYMIKYGYLQATDLTLDNLHETKLTKGIIHLQKEGGLPQTGIMDSETLNLIKQPRCGVHFEPQPNRKKRFVIKRKWDTLKNSNNETMVTWYLDFSNFRQINTTLSQDVIRTTFATGFSKWSNTSLLSIKEVFDENMANITIKFLEGNHGDGHDFDGPGQLLAHAFYPISSRIGGDAHFDLGEKWTLWDSEDSTSLFAVAIHEIGHSLGIGHSSESKSIMYAWYRPQHIELHDDDKHAINSLYGVRPQFKFGVIEPKHRIYNPNVTPPVTIIPRIPITTKSITTPRIPTTTQKYKLKKLKSIFIKNSNVYIYPKSSSTYSF